MNKRNNIYRDCLFAVISAFIAAFNLNSFLYCCNIIPGGFTGISLLITNSAAKFFNLNISYSVVYLMFNIPAALIVFRAISKRFTLVSIIDVVLTSILVSVLPKIAITDDYLLAAVFGGIVGGISNGFVIMANACAGGMDFLTIYFSKKFQRSTWNETFAVSAAIIVASGLLFGMNAALYSIIYQYVMTQVIKAFDNRYKRSCLFIISDKHEEIIKAVEESFHHSTTVFDAVGAHTNENKKVLYAVCGDYELNKFVAKINEIDPKAFVNVLPTTRLIGNFRGIDF